MRRTKIVVTLGPATDAEGVLDSLLLAGMDCARLNCSHGGTETLVSRTKEVRAAAARAAKPVALLYDLQGPKIRLSPETPVRSFRSGERVFFAALGEGDGEALEVDFRGFVELCRPTSQLVIADGAPRFQIVRLLGSHVEAIASIGGLVGPNKGVNITKAEPLLPALTPKDKEDIYLARELEADYVALSFVRRADDVELLRSYLEGSRARIIAKIEKVEAFERLSEIVKAADGVMVARGDYGVEAGLAHVGRMQKEVIREALRQGKTVITATQMLESMISCPEPTRAEALDVYNAVLDGTSAMMLSAETSIGQFPVEAVSMMAQIARIAEEKDGVWDTVRAQVGAHYDEAIMHAAVALASEIKAKAILVPTASGGTARACAKHRPHQSVVALCHDGAVARQLTLEWGILPVITENLRGSSEEVIRQALLEAKGPASLSAGDMVVVTAGPRTGLPGSTNLITDCAIP